MLQKKWKQLEAMLPNVVEIINIKVNVNNIKKKCASVYLRMFWLHNHFHSYSYKLIACSAKLLDDYATLHKAHYKLENCYYHHFIVWFMVCIRLMSYIAKTYIMVLHMKTVIKVLLKGIRLFFEHQDYWMNR